MKIIQLNIWGGKLQQPLLDFLARHKEDTELFCFQEVYNGQTSIYGDFSGKAVTNIHQQVREVLVDFSDFYEEAISSEERGEPVPYGISMFVKKMIPVIKQGCFELFSPQDEPRLGMMSGIRLWNRLLQFVTISIGKTEVTIFNLHGLYLGGGKNDNPARLEQSEKVRSIMQTFTGKKILCGDFNLNPDTQSMALLEDGMKNLIKENGVTSTRSHHYTKELKFADYILISPDVRVGKFQVLDDVVSDHLALMLETVD